MNPGQSPDWLLTTVGAVRELMVKRLEAESLDGEAKREQYHECCDDRLWRVE